MKKFRYKLQPVLILREQTEKIRQREFASALHLLQNCRQRIVDVHRSMQETHEGMRIVEEGKIDMKALIAHRRVLNYLEARLAALFREQGELMQSAEAKRLELVQASKEKKALVKLREKQYADYMYAASREEGKFFDEIGNTRSATAVRGGSGSV